MRLLYTKVQKALVFLCSCAVFFAANGQVGTVQLGSGNATQSYFPLNYNYNYNYSQTIYTAAELSAAGLIAGPITKISYLPTSAVSTEKWRQWTVFVGNSTKQSFTSTTDFVDVTTLSEVFSGNVINNTVANQWIDVVLGSSFVWDGTSNIIVAVKENSTGYGGNPNFASYTLAPATGNKGLTAYRDGTVEINPATPNATATATLYKQLSNSVAQIKFEGILAACLPVNSLVLSGLASETADLSWVPNGAATTWDVEWGTVGFTPGTGAQIGTGTASQTSFQITGLSDLTTYHAYVRSNCGVDGTSTWVGPIAFTTLQVPVSVPYYDAFDSNNWNITTGSGVNQWAIGSAAGNPANSLYISNNNGTSAQYTITTTSNSRASKVFTLPATSTSPLKIRYNWIGIGEGGFDRIRVWLVPATSALPAMGTDISITNTTGARAVGPTNHSGTIGGTWQLVNYEIPADLLGTTVQVVIEWKNDGLAGNNTTAQAIDNFAIYSAETSPTIEQAAAVPTCLDGSELTIAAIPASPNVAYWQVSATGTETTNSAATPWTVFENGTYYVRNYNTFTNEWSDATSIEVTNFEVAVAPPAPIAAANPACLPGTEIVIVGNAPADVAYFWQGQSANNSNMDLPATSPYFVSETGTYYVKAKNNISGCWSEAVGLNVVINTVIPATPIVDVTNYVICEGEPSLTIGGNVSTIGNVLAGDVVPNSGCTNGVMFNIQANTMPLTIVGFDIIPNTTSNQNVEVYTKSDSYVGSETQQAAWTLIGTYPITGVNNVSQYLDIDDFNIGANELRGIYLKFNGKYDDFNQTFANDDLTILPGIGQCTAWTTSSSTRVFAGRIHYQPQYTPTYNWYETATGGNIVETGIPLEAVGSAIMPVAVAGDYSFFLGVSNDVCESPERVEITVSVVRVNMEIEGIDASCNNGNDGTFEITDTICGAIPFEYSVNGGAFSSTIPTDLTIGTYTVIVKDANGDESVEYSFTVGSPAGPSGVVETSATNSSAVVSWVANGSETQWNIEWGPLGFTPGTGTAIGTGVATDTTFTITGLDSNTEYDVYVAANCGAGSTVGDWASVEIWTKCDAFNIPFEESFEDDSESISCWDVTDVIGNGNWIIATGSTATITTAYQGTKNARFTGAENSSARLVTPTFDVANQDSVVLVYAIGQPVWASDQNTTKVYSRSSANDPWVLIKDYTTNINTWKVDTLVVDVASPTVEFSFVALDFDGRKNVIDEVKVFPCFIEPSADVTSTVCRTEQTIDLLPLINPAITTGRWIFNEIPSLMNGSQLSISNLADGTYNVYYVISTPCTSDTTVATITVVSPGGAGVGSTITACKNQHVNLFSGLSGIVDFSGTWYAANGTALTSSTFVAGTLTGQYVYKYVVDNGACDADTTVVILSIGSCNYLGAEEVSLLENVTVSPNPSNGLFQISGISSPDFKFEVLDLNGRVVLSEKSITSSVTNVNLSTVENGVYIIRLKGDASEKMIRVIKQ